MTKLLVNQHNIPEKCFYDRKSLNNHIQHKRVRDMEYFFAKRGRTGITHVPSNADLIDTFENC